MAKISVIVPVYKVEPYLRRCVDSILNQSYQNFELILVDDGSPDNCGAICDEYASSDSRIHVIHQENGGLSAARNSGIDWAFENSDSQWLTFIDSDDWVHRDYLALLLTGAEKGNCAAAICGPYWTDKMCADQDVSKAEPQFMDAEDAFVVHQEKCTPAHCKIYWKQLFTDIRFPVGKLHEDAFVTHRVLFPAKRVAVFSEKLYYYYNNQASITRSKWSDRKLDSIEAHEQRLSYFRDHGYEKAYRRQQQVYLEELTFKLLDLAASEEKHPETMAYLRGKLRPALKKARQEGLVPWNGETMWSYFFALRTDLVWKSVRKLQTLYHTVRKA